MRIGVSRLDSVLGSLDSQIDKKFWRIIIFRYVQSHLTTSRLELIFSCGLFTDWQTYIPVLIQTHTHNTSLQMLLSTYRVSFIICWLLNLCLSLEELLYYCCLSSEMFLWWNLTDIWEHEVSLLDSSCSCSVTLQLRTVWVLLDSSCSLCLRCWVGLVRHLYILCILGWPTFVAVPWIV